MLWFKSKQEEGTNTAEICGKVVIETSICTGEKLIGFKNEKSGKLEKAVVVHSQKDIDDFYKKYSQLIVK